jgi:hypothetical protein
MVHAPFYWRGFPPAGASVLELDPTGQCDTSVYGFEPLRSSARVF